MTPKEKAQELIERLIPFCTHNENGLVIPVAKQCALIAVNEIIEATITEIDRPDFCGKVYSKFWQEVKDNIH